MEACIHPGHLDYIQQKKRTLVREGKMTETLLAIIMYFSCIMQLYHE